MVISLLTEAMENDVLTTIQEIQSKRHLTYDEIKSLMGDSGKHISKSILARVFAPDADKKSFNYHVVIEPIAKALLEYEVKGWTEE